MKTQSPRRTSNTECLVAVIGAGPAGLMAAEIIARAGYKVHIYDAKPSAARKFLLAGVGGMNITHAEEWPLFISRYAGHQDVLKPVLENFGPTQLRAWIHDLGIDTFVGSSGRVFPIDMKAAPLLRAWLHRLRRQGVEFYMRHRCMGWNEQQELCFSTPEHPTCKKYSATVLALGGGSWPQLGSDGTWQTWLGNQGVEIKPLLPANCGFNVCWSEHIKQFAGSPIKNAELIFLDHNNRLWKKRGEWLLTDYGIEGSAVYALSAPLRDAFLPEKSLHGDQLPGKNVTVYIDLTPDCSQQQLQILLQQDRKGMSLGNLLRKKLKFSACEVALLHECIDKKTLHNPIALAKSIKSLPLLLESARPITEAISSAGGIDFSNLTEQLMIKKLPGVFCAGEMLDWEAPTGGYLLTACFATGVTAGKGVVDFLTTINR